MIWTLSHRADPRVLPLADAHYNRQKPGTPQFVAPGRCLVLKTPAEDAFWVTSWPQFARHAWSGAWVCTAFRREAECPHLASDMILSAVAATRWRFGPPPPHGMITFINPEKIRHKRDPGRCYVKAGFRLVGVTKVHHLLVFQLPRSAWGLAAESGEWCWFDDAMPVAEAPLGTNVELFSGVGG